MSAERYKIDKDFILNYDHDNPPTHGPCCYTEVVTAHDYDAETARADRAEADRDAWKHTADLAWQANGQADMLAELIKLRELAQIAEGLPKVTDIQIFDLPNSKHGKEFQYKITGRLDNGDMVSLCRTNGRELASALARLLAWGQV